MSRSAEFQFGAAHMERLGEYSREVGMGLLNYAHAYEDFKKGHISDEQMTQHAGASGRYITAARIDNTPANAKSQTFIGKSKPRGMRKTGRSLKRDWN